MNSPYTGTPGGPQRRTSWWLSYFAPGFVALIVAGCGAAGWGVYLWIASPQWIPIRIANLTTKRLRVEIEDKVLGPLEPGEAKSFGEIPRVSVIRFRVLTGPDYSSCIEDWTLESRDLRECEESGELRISLPTSSGPGHRTVFRNGRAISAP
jgi:hypothetical protein